MIDMVIRVTCSMSAAKNIEMFSSLVPMFIASKVLFSFAFHKVSVDTRYIYANLSFSTLPFNIIVKNKYKVECSLLKLTTIVHKYY